MYRKLLNMFGMKTLSKPCMNPDNRLMIGASEDLSSQPIMVFADYMPSNTSALLPKTSDLSYEDVQELLASGQLTIDDFFQNVYPLGNPVERV